MLVHPELEALRGDPARQRRAQSSLLAALADWRGHPEVAALEAEVARFGAGTALSGLPALSALFAPGGIAAGALARDLAALVCRRLGQEPLAQVPLRHHTDDVVTSLVLARSSQAALCLQAIDGPALARCPAPVTASFSPNQTYEIPLAGSARVTRVRLAALRHGGAELTHEEQELRMGTFSMRDGAREVLVLREVPRSLVTLKLQRLAPRGAVAREYRLADGQLVHQAAANPQDSRLELAAALLGRMRRRDSAPLLAEIAQGEASLSLRWQALRECLGLDTATGFAALSAIAAESGDPLAPQAGALRAQLLETHPQLVGLVPCLA